jgi:hypothetical protein
VFDGWIQLTSQTGWDERATLETAMAASRLVGEADVELGAIAQDLGERFVRLVEDSAHLRVA